LPRITIKPLSINESFKGRRFKTDAYKAYEEELLLTLPKLHIPHEKLVVRLEFGFSSAGSDIDNAVKPFLDILQKKYGFNDNKIYRMILEKTLVKKGNEYIQFEIKGLMWEVDNE